MVSNKSSWIVKTIDEICEILDSRRVPLNKEARDSMKGNIPYYGANGIVDYINDFIFDEPLILMAEDGGHFDEYQTRPIAYKIEGKSWVNNHAHILRPIISESFDWIYYSLVHKNILNYISGGTRAKLNQSQLKKIPIYYPPIPEQRKIADILTSVDNAISKTEAIIEQTEKVKKGLMQQLLTKGIGHTKFKQTEIGEIPEEWNVVELNDVTDVRDGTHDSPKYVQIGVPLITSKNLKPHGLDFSDIKFISEKDHQQIEKRSKVDDGDILFGMIGTIGNPVIVNKTSDFSIKNVALIKFNSDKVFNRYIYYLLNCSIIQKQFNKGSDGGVQKFVALGTIRKLKIPHPSVVEQNRITDILTSIDNKIKYEQAKLTQLNTLKKGLMQVLLTGKVRVTVDDQEAVNT